MPKLVYQDPESGQEVAIELNEQMPEVTIGRNPGNIVRVNNPSISRQHARIAYENGQCTLVDLDSSNGSYINGNRIRSQVLVDGDRIRVGEFPVDYIAAQPQEDGETAEVDKALIDQMMNGGGQGNFRRQTAIGGFGAEPGIAGQGQPAGRSWGQREGFGSNDADVFDFVDSATAPPESGRPMTLPNDAIVPLNGSGSEAELDADDLIVDEEDLLEVVPLEEASDPSMDTYNAAPEEVAVSLRDLDREANIAFGGEHTKEDSGASLAAAAAMAIRGSAEEEPIELTPEPMELEELPEVELEIDALVSDSDPTSEALPAHVEAAEVAVQRANEAAALQERVEELEKERDELVDALANRAGEPSGAHQVQIERLRSERDRLIDERRNLKRQISDLQGDLAKAPDLEKFEAMESELTEVKSERSELQTELEGVRKELQDRDDQIEAAGTEAELLQAELEDFRARAAHGEELGQQLSGVQETLGQSTQELEKAAEKIAALETDLTGAHEEIQQLVADLELREQRIAEFEAELADVQGVLADTELALEETLAALEAANASLADVTERADGLQKELDSRPENEEVDQLVKDFADTREQLEQTTAERDALLADKAALEKAIEDHREGSKDLEKRHATLGKQLGEIKRERDELKTEKGAFARETDYLQVERRKLDSELRDLRKKVQKLEKDDKRKKAIFAELSGDLKKIVKENNDLQKRSEALQKQLDEAPTSDSVGQLEKELAEARKSIETLEKDTDDLTRELGSLGEEREALNEKIAELEPKVAELAEATAQVEAAQSKISELEGEVKEAIAAKDAAEAEVAAKEPEDVAALKKKLADAEETLAQIILERDKLEDQLKKKKK